VKTRALPLLSALALAAGAALLSPALADADCTSNVEVRRNRNGDVRPERRVSCETTARERASAERATAEKLAACRKAGFGDACDRLLAVYRAGLERHHAHVERRAQRESQPQGRTRSDR